MSLLWRIWLRAALILALLFGCNMVAPAMAAPDTSPALHSAGCHGGAKHAGGSAIACNSHCVAIPAETGHARLPVAMRECFDAASLPSLRGEAILPDTPPPRSA